MSVFPLTRYVLIGRGLPAAMWSDRGQDGPGTAALPHSSAERVPHSSQGFSGGGRQERDGEINQCRGCHNLLGVY